MSLPSVKSIKAFTLVELSIVIVIIGLLVGGVMAGMSLVKSARLQSVITDYNKYNTSYTTFKLQYNAIPGDMKNASSYWGTAVNGDGNRLVGDYAINQAEALGVWQHLALAGLIEGTYTGTYGAGIVLGSNAPKTGYNSKTTFYAYGSNLWAQYSKGNSMVLCGLNNVGFDDSQINVIDAYNIDRKIDDGMPYTGNIITYSGVDATCVPTGLTLQAGGNKKTTTYQLTPSTDLCTMHFAFSDYKFR